MTEAGKTLAGRYRIDAVLGQGGMGAVYLASMEALGGKKVAIKEMELRGFNERELKSAVAQFQAEAKFLAHLDHPNLVQVTDFFVEGDKHYLVMAYVSGQTLQQKLKARGKRFHWAQVAEWTRPLCDVLSYLHAQTPPILFRDLKPSNIMVEDSGRVKLIDFGIARTGQDGERTSTFLQGTGTSGFSPIEQYGGGQSTDHRSDIYSLGATLYQLLTGKVPPDAVSRVSQGAQVTPPSQIFDELPKALDAILLKALAQGKQDRYQSVAEMQADLASVPIHGAEDSETEDLKAATKAALGPGASSGSGAAAVPFKPNITVELIANEPATSPLQLAMGLGAAAILTVLLVGAFLNRPAADDPLARDAGRTPLAGSVAVAPDREGEAESAGSSGADQAATSTSRTEGRASAATVEQSAPAERIRSRTSGGQLPFSAGEPTRPPSSTAANGGGARPKVVSTTSEPGNAYPTRRPASSTNSSPRVEAPPPAPGAPERTAPSVAAESPPAQTAPAQAPLPPEAYGMPPVPPGMPDPLRGPDGRPLPAEMQPRGGPRPGETSGSPGGVPGYESGRRKNR